MKSISSEVIERKVFSDSLTINRKEKDSMGAHARPVFGEKLKAWRLHRRRSQLDFALDAEISQKHLSFMETGRSAPSRDMVVRLCECLSVPLRERNLLLLAAGYAPLHLARDIDDPSLAAARRAIDDLLMGHMPFPALAVDRHWTLIVSNAAASSLFALVGNDDLLRPPVNVLKLALHPQGLAPVIANLMQWRSHLLARLKQQIEVTADETLQSLLKELLAMPIEGALASPETEYDADAIIVPLVLRTPFGTLRFFSTTTIFGTPTDVTLSEIAIESFFPADDETRRILQDSHQRTPQ